METGRVKLFVVLLLMLLFANCSGLSTVRVTPVQPTGQPTLTSAAAPTRTPTPENTATATQAPTLPPLTQEPSITPLPTIPLVEPGEGVKTKGPYFFYARQMPDPFNEDDQGKSTILVAMDADASGHTVFTLPDQGYIRSLNSAISKDGEWVAYYTGSAQVPNDKGHYVLSLHIYQWKTGKDIKIADLLSKDYPDNFEKTAQFLRDSGPEFYKDWQNLTSNLQDFFAFNIYHLAWSPDERYLAFASEQDGPSSDVYLYALHTGEIRRLTDGPAYVEWLRWTPDSQKIFHYSAYNGCEGECGTYHVVTLDGKASDLDLSSYGGINIFSGWMSDNQMSMYSHANGPRGPLRYVNVDTGEDRIVFDHGVQDASYNKTTRQWLINLSPRFEDTLTEGWYLFNLQAQKTQPITLTGYTDPLFACTSDSLTNPDMSFVIICERRFVFLVHRDGSLSMLGSGEINLTNRDALSPDGHWLLSNVYNQDGKTAETMSWFLFNTDGNPWTLEKQFLSNAAPASFYWQPDSRGFFFTTINPDTLNYYSLETQQAIQVDNQLREISDDYNGLNTLWRP